MSAGDLDNTRFSKPLLIEKIGERKFGELISFSQEPPKNGIDATWDIPFLCGISKDGDTGYVHRALVWVDHDPTDFEVAMGHERGELFMIRLGWKYARAHEVGNVCEQELHSILEPRDTFTRYNERIEKHADAIEARPILRCPPDLALYPYAGNKGILQEIKYAQRYPKKATR